MNIHRTGKSGCEHMINHFCDVCPGSTFSIQIIEVFKGDGYNNNKVCPVARKIRIGRENFWMKELRTIFPYGLNERAGGQGQNLSIVKLCPSIPRHSSRFFRSKNNPTNNSPLDKKVFSSHLILSLLTIFLMPFTKLENYSIHFVKKY